MSGASFKGCMLIEPAGGEPRMGGNQLGTIAIARGEATRAAWMKCTAGGNGVQARHRAVDLREARARRAYARNRPHQSDRIRMQRVLQYVAHAADLDDAARIH